MEGLEFHAFHGCFDKEKSLGNLFLVDFSAKLDMAASAASDNLEDTVDCNAIYGVIAREMEVHSDLLESLAWRIADALAESFPELSEIGIRVSKKNPPLPGICAWSRVSVKR